MSNDDFDDIVNGMEENGAPEEVEFSDMTDVLFHYWKKFNPGQIPIKGMFIIESTGSEGRTLFHESSSPSSEWEILGMLESVSNQIKSQSLLESLGFIVETLEGDEEDDE